MQTENETVLTEEAGLALRMRPPQGSNPRILLLIHGLSGDEKVMWVFARRLPKSYWMLSPRAPEAYTEGGYTWVPAARGIDTPVDEYLPAADRLIELVDRIQLSPAPDKTRVDVLGFSQGGALALTLALTHPQRIGRVGCLAGFLPEGAEKYTTGRPLADLPVFMANGTLDTQVPIERAREAARLLGLAGARVISCEDEVGHKLSVNCFRGMENFFQPKVDRSEDL